MSCVTLNTGAQMPCPGLGVYRMVQGTAEFVATALKAGYRHIDTAAYYQNEQDVGRAVRESGIPRSEIFLTTKLWNDDQRQGVQRQAFERSMERLGLDYVDLYLVHWPLPDRTAETWRAMEEIFSLGRARAIGVSNYRIRDLEQVIALGGTVPAVNQIECHPYLPQSELIAYCAEKGIAVQAWAPFSAGKTDLLKEPALLRIAGKHGVSPAQVILRWNLQRGVTPLPKSQNPARQRENLQIFDFSLDDADMRAIAALDCGRRTGPDPDSIGQ